MGSDSDRDPDIESDSEGKVSRHHSQSSCPTEDDEDLSLHLGPKVSLKEHLEKDKVGHLILHSLILYFQ